MDCSSALHLLAELPVLGHLHAATFGHEGAAHEHCFDNLPAQPALKDMDIMVAPETDPKMMLRQLRSMLTEQPEKLKGYSRFDVNWSIDDCDEEDEPLVNRVIAQIKSLRAESRWSRLNRTAR